MKTICALTALTAGLLLTGCNNTTSPDAVGYSDIIHDLSFELKSSTERPVDVNRHINLTADINTRLFWDDLGRVFYTDHASALTPLPTPPLTGKSK